MSIETLNADYGLAGQLKFMEGNGGFPVIEIENSKARAAISVYAGQVLSFQPKSESDDLMFLSENAYYKTGKAIKGGVPICWPWFGPDPEGLGRASHGFVRNRMWTVLGTESTPAGETKVKMGLVDTAETREIWPFEFELALEILVGDTLTIDLITHNTGEESFTITQALHTYFKIGDINQVKVAGLDNTAYLDKANGGVKTQSGDITVAEEVDRIYTDVQADLVIHDAALGRRIRIAATGSKTAVVWNPWTEIAAKMADLQDDDYHYFICVETTNAANEVVTVTPNSDYRLHAVYTIERDLGE